MANRRVAFIYPYAFQYRRPFHEQLRARLAPRGIEYQFIYSESPTFGAQRGDLDPPPWAQPVSSLLLRLGGKEIRYQRALRLGLSQDLVIVQQENGLLVNYVLQLMRPFGGPRVAFFGHGKNFQSTKPAGLRENFKRFWLRRADWWFAYTEATARIVEEAGFPRQRITVFNNAVDTTQIKSDLATITSDEQAALRASLVAGSENVAVYVGALYPLKRIGFMLAASQLIKRRVPDFQLLVIGGGEDASLASAAATEHNWIHYLGPKFGRERTLLVSLAKVFMMPGAAGLAVLDAFVHGVPMVATDFPFHGPEIEYLRDDVNGFRNIEWTDASSFANAVVLLLQDPLYHARLSGTAKAASAQFTIELMVERVADGILAALDVRGA